MNRYPRVESLWMCSIVMALANVAAASAAADSVGEGFAKDPTWAAPSASAVKAETLRWLDARKPEEATRKAALALWPQDKCEPAGAELLARVVKTIALADPQAREVVDFCAKPKQPGVLPAFVILTDEKTPALERNNLRLWYGRWLVLGRHYEEALVPLKDLEPADVVDPASLLFYQATAKYWLLHKETALATIARLLERKNELPRRYAESAALMQADLAALQEHSLHHIDRRMLDVGIRLDLGQAGKQVQGVEDGIIASLDKLIAEGYDCPRNPPPGQPPAANKRSSSPAPDSARLKGTGPGDVAKKPLGTHANWGDLDQRQRQVVLQSIGKELPSHYRDIIEQYFKRLAADDEAPGK